MRLGRLLRLEKKMLLCKNSLACLIMAPLIAERKITITQNEKTLIDPSNITQIDLIPKINEVIKEKNWIIRMGFFHNLEI